MYFISKPTVYNAFQWTGSNFSDAEDWCEENAQWAMPIEDLGDGVLSFSPYSGIGPIGAGGYILANGGAMTPESMSSMQEVSGPDFIYSTEEAP